MGSTQQHKGLAWRNIGIALALAGVLACGGLLWAIQASFVAPFMLPGASNIAISPRGTDGLRISYQAAGPPYSWRDSVWRQLTTRGWVGRDYTFGVTRQFAVTWYTRVIELGPVSLVENAVVGGDPADASVVIIEVHRELRFGD